MLAPFTGQLVVVSFHTGVYVFKASKYLVYLSTDQKGRKKNGFGSTPKKKSESRFSRDISGQSVPVILHCGIFLLKYGLNDIIDEKFTIPAALVSKLLHYLLKNFCGLLSSALLPGATAFLTGKTESLSSSTRGQ